MKKLVGVALLATLVLTACDDSPDPHANDKCVHTHEESYTIPIYSGSVNGIPIYTYDVGTQNVCDKWVPKGGK